MLLLRHCQTLKEIKWYCYNLKCLPLHAHTKKRGGWKITIYKISYISIFEKGPGRGFHMIDAKRQPNNSFLCSKIRKGKNWKWACHVVLRKKKKGQFVFRTENIFFFLSEAWEITREVTEVYSEGGCCHYYANLWWFPHLSQQVFLKIRLSILGPFRTNISQ